MATRFDPPPLQRAVTYRIYPSPTKPDFVIGSKLIRALATTTSQLTFQVVATAQETTWQIVDHAEVLLGKPSLTISAATARDCCRG